MFAQARPLGPGARLVAVGAAAVAVLAASWLQALAWRLRAREERSPLASNLRDLTNLASVATLFAAFLAAGLPGPAAFLCAGSVAMVQESVRHLPAPRARPRTGLATGLALALPVAAFPAPVLRLLERLASRLF